MDALNLILALILAKIKDASSSIANIIDTTLTISGKAADAKITGDKIEEVKEDLLPIQAAINELYGGVPTDVRQAMLSLFDASAYANAENAQSNRAIVAAWAAYTSAIVLDQSAIAISGASTVQLTATTTPAGNTVSWASSDTSVATVSSSGLVTGTGNGMTTITATSGDIYATCAANVSGFAEIVSISAVYTQGDNIVYTDDSLDSLTSDLVVTATYDDSTTETVTGYTLSGTLAEGTSTVTVSYEGKTATFDVIVVERRWSVYVGKKVEVGTGAIIDDTRRFVTEMIPINSVSVSITVSNPRLGINARGYDSNGAYIDDTNAIGTLGTSSISGTFAAETKYIVVCGKIQGSWSDDTVDVTAEDVNGYTLTINGDTVKMEARTYDG